MLTKGPTEDHQTVMTLLDIHSFQSMFTKVRKEGHQTIMKLLDIHSEAYTD